MKNKGNIESIFIDIIKDFNNKIKTNGLNVVISTKEDKENKKNNDYSLLDSGRLLAMLYIFNQNKIKRSGINYINGVFYIKEILKQDLSNNIMQSNCVEIGEKIIENSIWKKEFLPEGIVINAHKQVFDIKKGFIEIYEYLIGEKNYLIKLIKGKGNEELFGQLISTLKILNRNDLNRQLKLIELRFGYDYCNKTFNTNNIEYNSKDFIEESCKIADELIEKSIIGIGDTGIEITWLRYFENKVTILEENNIYVDVFLTYLMKNTDKKYYHQLVIQSLKPAVRAFQKKHTDNVELQDTNILNAYYYVNSVINTDVLQTFIKASEKLFETNKSYEIDEHSLLKKALEEINNII